MPRSCVDLRQSAGDRAPGHVQLHRNVNLRRLIDDIAPDDLRILLAVLGYDVVDKKHQINEAEAQIIRFIYQAYIDGVPQKEIVAACKERGYKNKTGAEITLNSIKRFLQNRKYSGVHVLSTGEEIHGAYPPIVSAELDAAVRMKLAANAKAPGHAKAKAEYILHGKLFCGECGAPMIGECGRSRNGTFYYYYTCANKKKAHSCKKRNERKDELEEFIVNYIGSHILTDDWISDAADRVIAEYRKSYDASGIKPLEREIREVNKNVESLVDALVKTSSEIALEKINERLEAAEAKKHILEDQLATLKIASRAVLKKEDIVTWLNQFRTGNSRNREYQKKVIELFVNAIYIYDDKIKMFFNVTEESAQITYPEMLALEDLSSSDLGVSGPPGRRELCWFATTFYASHQKVISHPLRCSSSQNCDRFAGHDFVLQI